MSMPVIMYHHVLKEDSFVATSIDNFQKQMEFISRHYKTLRSDEFCAYLKGEKSYNNGVVITFDDGWRDNLELAYPILKQYNLRAILFVVTGWVDEASKHSYPFVMHKHNQAKQIIKTRPNEVILNYTQLENMQDVFDIHSHTHFHRDDYFGKISLEEELVLSKERLKAKLNINTTHLCWPRGVYTQDDIALAKKIGYNVMYTTKRGINKVGQFDQIKRLAVKKDDKWLKKQLFIFKHDIIGGIYAKLKP
ncbi:MAG: polysaccharide deacetylase family protein [Epsilonproteobacteria bacterium]|nr:polysaccharide deacetylase family protein [Campylobacterota bacterium]